MTISSREHFGTPRTDRTDKTDKTDLLTGKDSPMDLYDHIAKAKGLMTADIDKVTLEVYRLPTADDAAAATAHALIAIAQLLANRDL